ncbi:MAG: hypothetical protein VKQ33_15250 [Candidatus Sericytochromatia bacterium]|nr:hypothetical protein [Candidatus Sericytochromatia bacterium]
MRIKTIYRYVYVPAPVVPGPARTSISGAVGRLASLASTTEDEERRRQLEELRKALQRVASVAGTIRSSGMRGMLEQRAAEVMAKLDANNPEGALVAAEALVALANEGEALVDQVRRNLTALGNAVGVRGKAGKALQTIADMAEAMLGAATSPEALRTLLRLTDQARDAMRRLEGLAPGTREYQLILAELGGITDELAAMARGLDTTGQPRMTADAIMWQQDEGARVDAALETLRGATRDTFALAKLDTLDRALTEVLRAARPLGPEASEGLRATVDATLRQAAEGDLEGAIAGANALAGALGQATRLKEVLGGRLERLQANLAALAETPAADRLQAILTALRAGLQRAASPEALLALDGQLQAALEATSTLRAAGPSGRSVLHPAYRALLGVERALGAPGPGEAGAGARLPVDQMLLADGPHRGAAGIKPWSAGPSPASPAVEGWRRLAQGLPSGDAALIVQTANRATRQHAQAASPLERAAVAAELDAVSTAVAQMQGGGEAASAAREVLRLAFR